MNNLQLTTTTTPILNIQEYAHELAQQAAEPTQGRPGFDLSTPIQPGFLDRRLIAKARRSGLVATAKTWSEGQARLAELVVAARVELARQGLQGLVASLGAKEYARAAAIINEADQQFQKEITSQIVFFTANHNELLSHARAQDDPTLRAGLEKLSESRLMKFLTAIAEREDQFREITKKRIQEVMQ